MQNFSQKINIEESQSLISKEIPKKEFFKKEGTVAIDCYETPLNFIILTAIAGVKAESLDISIKNNILTIRGFRQETGKEENKKYFLKECFWGSFFKKIVLGEDVDISRTAATFQKGILKIKIPRIKKIKEKKIIVENRE